MCGIVGFVAPDPKVRARTRINYLLQGLIVDTLRGNGGTGIGIVRENGDAEVYRRALAGPDFINSEVCALAIDKDDTIKVAIGHNRAATIGTIKDLNCHPFQYQGTKRNIMLVHNGTLSNHYALAQDGFRHDVDSAYAAAALSNAEDPAKVLKKVRGPFVFVWWDGTEKTFNIARNEFREIYFIKDKESNLYFASEYKMLDWLADRNGIEWPNKAQFLYPKDHEWVSWDMSDGKIGKPKIRSIKPEKDSYEYPARSIGFVPDTNRNSYGWVDSRAAALKETGLVKGERIWAHITNWEDYSGEYYTKNRTNQWGKMFLLGKDGKGKEIEIWIHSITGTRFDHLATKFKGRAIPVLVDFAETNAAKLTNKDRKVVVCTINPADIVEEAKAQKKEDDEAALNIGSKDLDFIKGPRGLYIHPNEWAVVVNAGCAFCSRIPTRVDADKLSWIPNSTPPTHLCGTCAEDKEISELANMPVQAGSSIKEAVAVAVAKKALN